MAILQRIGRNIADLRTSKRITQEGLALKSGISVSYLREIEHGRANPTVETVIRLSEGLGEPFQALLEAEGE